MPEIYAIPEESVVNRTLGQAIHEAYCINPRCAHVASEADGHLAEVALAWVRLRAKGPEVFELVRANLTTDQPPEDCPDPECSWENHNAAHAIMAVVETL